MAEHVIIVGFDGLRPDAVNAEDCPHLYRLLRASAVSANHRAVYPTETRVNLTAISTGGTASEHGVVANELMSRSLGDGSMLSTGSISDLMALNANSGGKLLGLQTASEFLGSLNRSMAVLSSGAEGSWRLMSWDAERNGHFAFNPNAPLYTSPHGDLEELRRKFVLDADHFPKLMTDIFLTHVWPQYRPALSIVWFAETDKAAHLYGPGSDEVRKALSLADEQLGRIVEWRERQSERSEIAIIAMSDHGHMSIAGKVSVVETLRSSGFRASTRLSDNVDVGVVSGSSTNLWFRNADDGYAQAVHDVLAEQPWFGVGLSRANDGGIYGHIRGTFSLDAVGAQHTLSPDLVVLFRGGAEMNQYGAVGTAYADIGTRTYPIGGGYHGGLHPMELRCLFALNSPHAIPGVYNGYTSTADVLPTVYEMLGLGVKTKGSGRAFSALRGPEDDSITVRHIDTSLVRGQLRYLERVRVGDRYILEGMTAGRAPSELLPPQTPKETESRPKLAV